MEDFGWITIDRELIDYVYKDGKKDIVICIFGVDKIFAYKSIEQRNKAYKMWAKELTKETNEKTN